MKIKKITIHGFKSFVDKVTLAFPDGTSGIIGPNGCGKSNIVDAIRWVLGEQNARHLRGKQMEDVIFNGSETRKPLGMAEVVLTFSNEDGIAPARFANFTEIEIARRLYRSGESEYSINKVQSRLRDVVDLFTDTGIGTRAYSIIEQGQVGWLIKAKPEERRTIFEEAAGINKFKHKKEAALRRLEATRENLTRVNDIISEVKRQLNSLNRQAKKAEKYKALRDELRSIEMILASLEFEGMRTALGDLRSKIEGIKDAELAATTASGEKERLADDIRLEHMGAEDEFKATRERVFEAEKLIAEQERKNGLLKMRLEELQRSEERLTYEITELERQGTESSSEIERLSTLAREVGAVIDESTGRLAENTAALNGVVAELGARENLHRAEKAESLKINTRLADIRHGLQTQNRDEEYLRVREAKAAAEKEEIGRTLQAKEEPLRIVRERLGQADTQRLAIEAEMKSHRERLGPLESERSSKDAALKRLKDEYSRASAKLATLEEMDRNLEGIKGGPKAVLLKGKNAGVYGLIADVIETNPGYEKAVEAVLGERLQYVLVESLKEGMEAIEFLKANSAGRGSFVPVKDARQALSPVPASGQATGAIELASELKTKDGYGTIVANLLGDTLVATTLTEAIELWREAGLYKTIVTLDGEVIDAQGTITGGSSSGTAGILQKRGEIKKIRAEASALEERTNALGAELKQTEDQLRSTRSELEGLKEKLHSTELARVNASGELKRLEDDSARLTRTRSNLETEINEAARRLTDISAKKASLTAERDELEKGFAEREERINAVSAEIAQMALKKEAIGGVVTELRVTLAQAKERSESIKRQVSDRERSVAETGRRIEAKKAEIEKGRTELDAKLGEIEAVKASLEGLLGRMDAIKAEETTRAELLAVLGERIKAIEAEIKAIKAQYSEMQELKGELTIEARELELGINNLVERVSEKYATDIRLFRREETETEPEGGQLEGQRDDLREKIASLGEVSLSALEEFAQLEGRHQFLLDQQTDLTRSVDALHSAITRINRTTREKFKVTFDEINAKFKETFPRFFTGGRAELKLTEGDEILEAGVEIVVQPPGKRFQNLTLLSGGEQALTATALIFAIFLIKPSPFCLLDEVDAPLDDANVDRFNLFVRDMAQISQFLLITHNKKTMEMADALYGITMQEPGVSKVVTMRF